MARIRGVPDRSQNSTALLQNYAGPQWLCDCIPAWKLAIDGSERRHVLDMSNVDFVTLPDWVATVAIIERIMAEASTLGVEIDLKGDTAPAIMEPAEFLAEEQLVRAGRNLASPQFLANKRAYRIAGFLESLGTSDVLTKKGRPSSLGYSWFAHGKAGMRSFYSRSQNSPTVIMPLLRIQSKDNCKQFLDQERIAHWRQFMQGKFLSSPLFESEELWRVFCHELAVNVWEHSNPRGMPDEWKAAGFLAGRVVSPLTTNGDIQPWCQTSFRPEIRSLFPRLSNGFLELCISDAGQGFAETLGEAFRNRSNINKGPINPSDILAFAFDELGTCKKEEQIWSTERHALGRILHIVAKYGGALVLRSGGGEVAYASHGDGHFKRLPNHLGYLPTTANQLSASLGSHFQLILPLVPFNGSGKPDRRSSILVSTLPNAYQVDPLHVRGHLIPLYEALDSQGACVGDEELLQFRERCGRLAHEILKKRPLGEALVLDFGELQWAPEQFETLLHLLQNVLQHRPALLVEINPSLALDVTELERASAPTRLASILADITPSVTGRAFAELSERKFLETFGGVHATLLGLDSNGKRYIFGLPHPGYETQLLELIDAPKTFEQLLARSEADPKVLMAILNNVNPLFFRDDQNRWRTVWDRPALANEARRVMSKHFDNVATQCQAWRGTSEQSNTKDSNKQIQETGVSFNLPWGKEWVSEFFECSRILSRQRHADEAAQRLIFRLQKGLESFNKSLEDVRVLACVTAPAILLATALHRWWPTSDRPAIADLGPYIMLNPDSDLPAIVSGDGIVVVQDVLDRGVVSGRLVSRLQQQGKEVLCILSLVKLEKELQETTVTPINEGWSEAELGCAGVREHSMIKLRRPPTCAPRDHNDPGAYWVEPRTLRPLRYELLRRERKPTAISPASVTPSFFKPIQEGVIHAGHYVYGERHYTVAIDVKRALEGAIGDEISLWLADLCQGVSEPKAKSNGDREIPFAGDVSAVLMPLHSQIHYLWPKVEYILAQRDRRQPTWLLDATLFLGLGAAYRLPVQFDQKVRARMRTMAEAYYNGKPNTVHGLRILIVDDAMFRARTAETILAEIDRLIAKAREDARKEFGAVPPNLRPIEWVRYFVVFNQMGYARHQHWHNLTRIGRNNGIPFRFDEYRWISGIPVFDDSNCPSCADVSRLKQLVASAERYSDDDALSWAQARLKKIQPVAIESPGFLKDTIERLPRPLDLRGRRQQPAKLDIYQVWDVDEGILRFNELIYLAYPPSDILQCLSEANAWPQQSDSQQVRINYERFRWAIFEWCFRNWPRLVADSAREEFIRLAKLELSNETALVEKIFEAMGTRCNDDYIKDFLVYLLKLLAHLEKNRQLERDVERIKNSGTRSLLEKALTIFLLGISSTELKTLCVTVGPRSLRLLDYLGSLAFNATHGLSFIRTLYLSFTRPRRRADPGWALLVVTETLFRGREANDPIRGSHRLLPRLLYRLKENVASNEDVRLIRSSLSLFRAALDELGPFVAEHAIPVTPIRKLSDKILDWLKLPPSPSGSDDISFTVAQLIDAIAVDSPFCTDFRAIFHETVGDLGPLLDERVKEKVRTGVRLNFSFAPGPSVKKWRVVAPVDRLCNFITNWGVDAAASRETRSSVSRVEVYRQEMRAGSDQLRFRILTNFAPYAEAEYRTIHGRHHDVEVSTLEKFGASMPAKWLEPSAMEKLDGFEAAYDFFVPGFI